jgi:hypothetical protein
LRSAFFSASGCQVSNSVQATEALAAIQTEALAGMQTEELADLQTKAMTAMQKGKKHWQTCNLKKLADIRQKQWQPSRQRQ